MRIKGGIGWLLVVLRGLRIGEWVSRGRGGRSVLGEGGFVRVLVVYFVIDCLRGGEFFIIVRV